VTALRATNDHVLIGQRGPTLRDGLHVEPLAVEEEVEMDVPPLAFVCHLQRPQAAFDAAEHFGAPELGQLSLQMGDPIDVEMGPVAHGQDQMHGPSDLKGPEFD